jgi:hypothetical protein
MILGLWWDSTSWCECEQSKTAHITTRKRGRMRERQRASRVHNSLPGHTLIDPKTPMKPHLVKVPHIPIAPPWDEAFSRWPLGYTPDPIHTQAFVTQHLCMLLCPSICLILQYWDLNSGPCVCWAGAHSTTWATPPAFVCFQCAFFFLHSQNVP